jgi:FAD/FMN-containing dehydrogenase
MDLVDLFIGSEGTLGVIVDATLRVIARPRSCATLITCTDDAQALAVTAALRDGMLDVAAIEYIDDRSLRYVRADAYARADIDLDDVVYQQHLHDAPQVDVVTGVVPEHQRVHRQVPRVLGTVFPRLRSRIGDWRTTVFSRSISCRNANL